MPNPYLQQNADAITSQANNNLFNYQLPQINSNALAAGGYGGSRQGIAQGLAIGQTNLGIGNALAGLYGNAYENDQNRGLQQQSLNTSQYNAETNRGLGFGQLDQSAQQNAFNNQLNGYNALMNWNNLGLGWANQQQQTPIQNLTALTNIGAGIGNGYGQVSTPYQGNPWLGALGGAQLLGNLFSSKP